jgi:DnaJ family protein C protein 19
VIWLLLLGVAVAAWAWKTGKLKAIRPADVAAILGAIVAVRMIGQGKIVPAAIALAGAGWWLYLRTRRKPTVGMRLEDARALLEVPPDADREAIRAAHRRLIARVHPDIGGSAELARKVNLARDTLLAELRRRT